SYLELSADYLETMATFDEAWEKYETEVHHA
ncbi:YozE family protein, partial [Bacillus velezensis]